MLVKSSLSVSASSFCFLPSHLVGLRIELRASCMQGKCSTTELHNPHPWFSKGFYWFPPTLQCCLGYQDQQWDIKKKTENTMCKSIPWHVWTVLTTDICASPGLWWAGIAGPLLCRLRVWKNFLPPSRFWLLRRQASPTGLLARHGFLVKIKSTPLPQPYPFPPGICSFLSPSVHLQVANGLTGQMSLEVICQCKNDKETEVGQN